MRARRRQKGAVRRSRNVNVRSCAVYEKSNGSSCRIPGFVFDGRVQSVTSIGQRRRGAGGAGRGRREREWTAIQSRLEGRQVQCLIVTVGDTNVHARPAAVTVVGRLVDRNHGSNRIHSERGGIGAYSAAGVLQAGYD